MKKTSIKDVIKSKPHTATGFSDRLFRNICDRMPAMVAVYSINNGEYIYVNKTIRKLLGYEPEDFTSGGLTFVTSLIHPDDVQPVLNKNNLALEEANRHPERDDTDEPIVSFEYRLRHADGHYVWIHTDGSVFSRKNGVVDCVLNTSIDISEHKALMAKLSKTNTKIETAERFVLSQSVARVGTFEWLLDENRLIWSPEMESLYGLRQGTFTGTYEEVTSYIHPDDKVAVSKQVSSAIKGGPPFNIEFRIIQKNGSVRWLLGRGKVIKNKEGNPMRFIGVNVDITEQRKAAEDLRKSEERLALALEASKLGLWEWDVATGQLMWSSQLKKIFGFKQSENITYERYLETLHPDDKALMQKTIKTAMKTGKNYQVEHRVVWPDGSIHWVLGQGKAILRNGRPVRMIGTSINIDERKRAAELMAETERLTDERRQLLVLNTAKDEFISIASHQLRTPATGVKQYLGMLLAGYAGNVKLTKRQLSMIQIAYESNERQIKIINDLLKVAQVDSGKISLKREKVQIVPLIKRIKNDLGQNFSLRGQEFTLRYPDEKLTAFLDKSLMRMAIENLLDNANKYSPDGHPVTVSVTKTAKHVLIRVADKGVGIAAEDKNKLFEKFSRINNALSTTVGGNGLGLYWVKKIISLHGGTIEVKSRLGEGSTFTIKLPIAS